MSQFDDETRIEKKQKKIRLTIFACKRCSAKFFSNIKLHQHVQNHHQKKIEKSANEISKSTSNESAIITSSEIVISTSFFTSTAKSVTITIAKLTFSATSSSSSESTLMLTSFVNHSESIIDNSLSLISSVTSISTSTATSNKSIFWIEIISRSVVASKSSRLSVLTSKIISKTLKIASVICSSISSSIFSQKSISKYQHQKFYFTIDDLFEMFAEKRMKLNLLHIKKIEFFSKISRQFKIIFYFRSVAVNQNKTINQNSKTSNSKNFQQHTLAESNRIKFIFNKWFEKSIILSYKSSIFSRLFISKISSISLYKMSSISCFQSMIVLRKFSTHLSVSSILEASFKFSTFFHICRICSDSIESNNDLHRHLRTIHFDHASRHEFEKHRALERNIMTWKFLIFWRKNRSFFYLFSCITIRFFEERIACFRHVTQRERCGFFSLMASVTINLHIKLKSEYFDKNELASWQSDSYFAFCFLDSNNSIILFTTLLFNTFYRNKYERIEI